MFDGVKPRALSSFWILHRFILDVNELIFPWDDDLADAVSAPLP